MSQSSKHSSKRLPLQQLAHRRQLRLLARNFLRQVKVALEDPALNDWNAHAEGKRGCHHVNLPAECLHDTNRRGVRILRGAVKPRANAFAILGGELSPQTQLRARDAVPNHFNGHVVCFESARKKGCFYLERTSRHDDTYNCNSGRFEIARTMGKASGRKKILEIYKANGCSTHQRRKNRRF